MLNLRPSGAESRSPIGRCAEIESSAVVLSSASSLNFQTSVPPARKTPPRRQDQIDGLNTYTPSAIEPLLPFLPHKTNRGVLNLEK